MSGEILIYEGTLGCSMDHWLAMMFINTARRMQDHKTPLARQHALHCWSGAFKLGIIDG